MKKRSLVAIIGILLILCAFAAAAQAPLKGKAVVIRKTADFWTLESTKAMKWVETLSLGQELTLLKGTEEGTYKGTKYTLVKVQLDSGKEGYVIETLVAKEPILGAISSDLATLYSQAKDTAILSTILPVGNLVALWPVAGKPDFYMISAYDMNTGTFHKERYILSADVTVRAQDIKVILLLNAAAAMPKKEQKQKILETISSKYSDTVFQDLVQALRDEVSGGPAMAEEAAPAAAAGQVATVEISGTIRAVKSLNLRDKPSTDGKVLRVIDQDALLDVIARTSDVFTIGSDTDYWYQVKSPAKGWVFGAFIRFEAGE